MPGRPTLKLKLSTKASTPTSPDQPSSSHSTTKIRLNLNSTSSAAATSPPPPTPKIHFRKASNSSSRSPALPSTSSSTSRKRSTPSNSTSNASSGPKRLKIITSSSSTSSSKKASSKRGTTSTITSTPIIRVKAKGRPPHHPLGDGYDSEASDREIDPHIEEEFILRMTPGEDCEYLRQAIATKKLGLKKAEGGADVTLKFLNREGRRALVTIRGRHYAASMVDLPCIVEGMKSWDRKAWVKTADVCQMLIVWGRVEKEELAVTWSLPRGLGEKDGWAWPSGLTPPMKGVRGRRFRKRVSNRVIEFVEDEVERLLVRDREWNGGGDYELVEDEDVNDSSRSDSGSDAGDEEGEDEDAEGELYEEPANAQVEKEYSDTFEKELEAAMLAGGMTTALYDAAPPAIPAPNSGPTMDPTSAIPSTTAATPVADATTPAADASEQEDDDDDNNNNNDNNDDDDDASDDDASVSDEDDNPPQDEAAIEAQKQAERQREEIADLESAIANETAKLSRITNMILRNRQTAKIRNLEADLLLKKGGGEGDDD